ncbi:uncharacterized protein [Macrobrachium rosenbergii]|uniref:uncharacterized protein n=1 Tax=Macrobrachium rosenbergii TaxID=79674 RepID=UPI0034D52597
MQLATTPPPQLQQPCHSTSVPTSTMAPTEGQGLGNWEVGRTFRERPRARRGATKVIADDRGHLLPGVPRTQASPWGPLTQTIDPNVTDRPTKTSENQNAQPESEDEKDGSSDEDIFLKITGNGLMSGSGSSPGSAGGNGHSGAATPASSISAASFRKRSAVNAAAPSSRASRRSSAAGSHCSSAASTASADRALKEVAHLPTDTVEDALLPRKPEEELTELTGSRALAIRLVDHPAPTNCTKYVILRPNTAPSPAPVTKPPLLPKRPKTAKIIRKVPEIEFALKWDLKENDILEEEEEEQESEDIEVVDLKKGKKHRDPPTPRSVSSIDSGIHAPKAAWNDGPDTHELTTKLENLKINHGAKSRGSTPEPESGYGTPKSVGSGKSLPSVSSRASSRAASVKSSPKTDKAVVGGTGSIKAISQKISMDAQRLAQESPKSSSKSRGSSPSLGKQTPKSAKESARSGKVHYSSRESKSATPQPQEKNPPAPPVRDPLEIMETMDSVFHVVPLRDTGRSLTQRSYQPGERQHVAATTQTEDVAEDTTKKNGPDAIDARIRHNHPKHIHSRNCLACEVRALEDPPKKFQGPSDYKPAFKAGKPHHHSSVSKPKYIRQSDRYNARLKARHEPLRIWKINTLSSPFCNRPGYGQDQYPDHMRLRSTYGMANATSTATKPSQRGPLIKKLYL